MTSAKPSEPQSFPGGESLSNHNLTPRGEQIEPAHAPLTPMQEIMLAEATATVRPGANLLQIVAHLPEPLEPAALREAWVHILARHDALRCRVALTPENTIPHLEFPTQAILPWREEDLTAISPEKWEEEFEAWLARDLAAGFGWEEFPWLRVALIRRGPSDWVMVWTVHHLLVDGASLPIVVGGVLDAHDLIRSGANPAGDEADRYETFARRSAGYRAEASPRHWRQLLLGLRSGTGGPAGFRLPSGAEGAAPHRLWRRLPTGWTDRLATSARRQGVTSPTLIHGAWALLLAQEGSSDDVVFGTVREGRLASLGGTPATVGCFVNTLPMRVRIERDTTPGTLLAGIHTQWLTTGRHTLTPWTALAAANPLPRGARLFESFVAVHRSSLNRTLRSRGGAWEHRRFEVRRPPGLPWRLEVILDPEAELHLTHPLGSAKAPRIGSILDRYFEILEGLIDGHFVSRPPLSQTPEAMPARPSEGADTCAAREENRSGGTPVVPAGEVGTARRIAPRSPIEHDLHHLWQVLLGRSDFGVTDDFFQIGGHSLLAVRLLFSLRSRFGTALSITTLREKPTIEALAHGVVSGRPDAELEFHGAGDGPPLFFVPGIPGVNYLPDNLRKRLAAAGRICDGLQFPGVDGREEPLDAVANLAAAMIRHVERVWPAGPIWLTGYSLGGIVAFEMARQLEARGRRPELLLLLDAYLPSAIQPRAAAESLLAVTRHFRAVGFRESIRFLLERSIQNARRRREQLAQELGLAAHSDQAVASVIIAPLDAARKRLFDASFRAAHTLRPDPPYGGQVVLLRAAHRDVAFGIFRGLDPLNGWAPMARRPLIVEDFATDHWNLLQGPAASAVGDRIAGWMQAKRSTNFASATLAKSQSGGP